MRSSNIFAAVFARPLLVNSVNWLDGNALTRIVRLRASRTSTLEGRLCLQAGFCPWCERKACKDFFYTKSLSVCCVKRSVREVGYLGRALNNRF